MLAEVALDLSTVLLSKQAEDWQVYCGRMVTTGGPPAQEVESCEEEHEEKTGVLPKGSPTRHNHFQDLEQ